MMTVHTPTKPEPTANGATGGATGGAAAAGGAMGGAAAAAGGATGGAAATGGATGGATGTANSARNKLPPPPAQQPIGGNNGLVHLSPAALQQMLAAAVAASAGTSTASASLDHGAKLPKFWEEEPEAWFSVFRGPHTAGLTARNVQPYASPPPDGCRVTLPPVGPELTAKCFRA